MPGEIRPDRPGRRGTGGGDVDTKKNEGPRGNQNPSVSSSSLKYAATQSFSQPRSASTSFWPRFRRRCRRSPLRRLRRRLRRLRPLRPRPDHPPSSTPSSGPSPSGGSVTSSPPSPDAEPPRARPCAQGRGPPRASPRTRADGSPACCGAPDAAPPRPSAHPTLGSQRR